MTGGLASVKTRFPSTDSHARMTVRQYGAQYESNRQRILINFGARYAPFR